MRNHRGQSGYSLAELLTVIAIIGALALVTVPAFMTFMQSNKMKSSMRQFTSDLRAARARAIGQGQQIVVTFGVGSTARSYDVYQGDRPFSSVNWSRPVSPESLKSTRYLDNVVYFPADGASTPQTMTDLVDCSTTPCKSLPPTGTGTADGKFDIIFFPDGRVQMPGTLTVGTITVKTDMKIPKPQYAITLTPSGGVRAN